MKFNIGSTDTFIDCFCSPLSSTWCWRKMDRERVQVWWVPLRSELMLELCARLTATAAKLWTAMERRWTDRRFTQMAIIMASQMDRMAQQMIIDAAVGFEWTRKKKYWQRNKVHRMNIMLWRCQ